ncbi:patatin-like phospholipase family protein [Sessilibacter corallicola]|uniref:patatin-like phospholipase family protein n=1 Tax=Sessilibacter corallicola TaxID=2904075 RepID=UPI001E4F98FB|nr:patatin-like phospholipase family protein [Sessilibacter corallicola]MCE2029193.1 patatin-like phospholipase family protein [Sessilibacter corallicola]
MSRALVLSGGGARAAYQVGVLRAVSEIAGSSSQPHFPIICGTSAGAINALALACHAGNFQRSVSDLYTIWNNLSVEKVIQSGWIDMAKGVRRVAGSFLTQGISDSNPIALFDNSPLRSLIQSHINFSNLNRAIKANRLEAVSITAMAYGSGESISFFQGRSEISKWRKFHQVGVPTELNADHLLASSAIPGIFPTVNIEGVYYGDGAIRQLSPLNTALHLGASKIFVVGVSNNRNPAQWGKRPIVRHSPSVGQMVGHLLNSAFIDSMDSDLGHLEHINELVSLIPEDIRLKHARAKVIETASISPSKELDRIAGRHVRYLPNSMKFFLRSSGATAKAGGAALASYVLFSHKYCRALMELGYKDAMWEKQKIESFFED